MVLLNTSRFKIEKEIVQEGDVVYKTFIFFSDYTMENNFWELEPALLHCDQYTLS